VNEIHARLAFLLDTVQLEADHLRVTDERLFGTPVLKFRAQALNMTPPSCPAN